MKLTNNNISPLPFYDALSFQNHRKDYAFGQVYALITYKNTLLPFQAIVDTATDWFISSAKLINFNTGAEAYNVFASMTDNGLELKHFDDFSIIKYPGIEPIIPSNGGDIKEGMYYLQIGLSKIDSTADVHYIYSDVFAVTYRIDDYLILEYSNTYDLEFKNGIVDFSDGFKFKCYLNAEIGKPEYYFEEEVSERMGHSFVESQVSKKIYKFNFLAPEYLCDALRIVRLCDTKKITSKEQYYDLTTFAMSSEWQEQGDIASVDCEFETDTVIANIGGYALGSSPSMPGTEGFINGTIGGLLNVNSSVDEFTDEPVVLFKSAGRSTWSTKAVSSISGGTSYDDLYTLTIQRNGVNVGKYKPSADATINIDDIASALILSKHIDDTSIHITSDERTAWNKIASYFYLDEATGNLVTDRNVIIRKNLTVGGDTSTGGKGEDTGVSGTVTGIRVDATTILEPTNGIVDMSDVLANIDVDLSNYYTKQETISEIAKAVDDLNLGQYAKASELATLQTEVDDIEAVLGMDEEAAGIINTWEEVKAFLDGYSSSDDLAAILSAMNADIAKRALASDLNALARRVGVNELAIADNAGNIKNNFDAIEALGTSKADKATTLAGYGITDAYTEDEIDGKVTAINNAIALKADTTALEALALTVGDNTTNIRNLKASVYTKDDLAAYKSWWDDLMGLIVKEGNDIKIKTNLIVTGDTTTGGTGSDAGTSGTVIGVVVNGQSYEDETNGMLDLSTLMNQYALTSAIPSLDGYAKIADVSAALTGYQPLITASNKLDYSLIANTPAIPTAASLGLKALAFKDSLAISEVVGLQSALSNKQDAATAINKSNIGDQSVNYATRAESANKINSRGNLTAYTEGSITKGELGLNLYEVYLNDYPVNFGNLLHINGGGAGQLLAEWCGSSDLGRLYYRSKRDTDGNGWSAWGKVAWTSDIPTNNNQLTNGAGYITGITKAMVEGVLTGNITSHTHTFASLTSKPTTISGYGITDAYTASTIDSKLSGYLPLSGGTLTGDIGWSDDSHGIYFRNGCGIEKWVMYGPTLVAEGDNTDFWIRNGKDRAINHLIFHTGNYTSYTVKKDGTGASGTWGINISGNAATATKLATPRTIWGQSFDGTANINGNIDIGGNDIIGYEGARILQNLGGNLGINPLGNVGIGTISPAYRLDVNGSARFGDLTPADGVGIIPFCVANSGYLTTGWVASFGTSKGGVLLGYREHNNIAIFGSSGCASLSILPDGGNVGIGTTSPSAKLHVNGNAIITGDTATGSDVRFKNIIKDHRIALESIAQAPLFTFKWNDRKDDTIHLGTSAQYWEDVAPWLVKGTDFKALDYSTLGVAIGISLANKTVNLEERVKILEKENEQLKKQIYGS